MTKKKNSKPEEQPKELENEAVQPDADTQDAAAEQAEAQSAQPETAQPEAVQPEVVDSEKESLASERDELRDKLLRTAAEYDNYRKRTEREKRESAAFGAAGALEKLLPAMDALELAAAADCTDEKYKQGVLMTLSKFQNALENAGAVELEALGADFDPNVHNAVARVESDEYESGKVCSVMQKGYRYGERVIRPAMVAVAE